MDPNFRIPAMRLPTDAEGYWNTIDRRLQPRRAHSRQEKYTESHLTRKWVALINRRSGNEAPGLLVCEPR
jgi:hypothetical protein